HPSNTRTTTTEQPRNPRSQPTTEISTEPGTVHSYLGVGIDDTTTSLTHIGAREYDQNTGRFLSADPIIHFDDPLQMNGYAYANNSPVTFSDPTGLEIGSTPGTCSWDIKYCTPDQESGKDQNNGARDNSGSGTTSDGATPSSGATPTKNKKPTIAGIPIPSPDEMLHRGIYASNYADAVHLWALNKCQSPSSAPHNTAFCGQAADIGLLDPKNPWAAAAVAVIAGCAMVPEACVAAAINIAAGEVDFASGGSLAAGAAAGPLLERLAGKLGGLFARGCNCFLAGTDVLMADGSTKDIEDIKIGDEVSATDPETGESGIRKVTRLIRTDGDKYFNELTIATKDGPRKLTATHEHPFWSPSKKRWVEAGALQPGTTLLSDDGTTVTVENNRPFTQHARTYNLTVEGLHTYYVLAGATPILVHNSGGCGGIALGLGEIDGDPMALLGFADSVGAKSYHDWPSAGDRWVSEFKGYVSDGKTPIHFNLNGIDNPVAAARTGRGLDPIFDGHATGWELSYIQDNPSAWSRVTFYRNGSPVANPFAP
ncbi:polymorphic toxin-type HINT domain-containing protein, partial [Streptomyces sp. NPDC056194]|uniref:polymorphic toxin-type HINT domain-containing protein n=1 Tax=Streptomyces sp. NPDC056194 TaxID=3345744 RepID=UPI0035E18E71